MSANAERGMFGRIARNPWVLAGGLALLVAAWLFSGVGASDAHSPAAESAARAHSALAPDVETRPTVQVRLQTAETVTRELTLSGRTAPARTVELKAETAGRVEATPATRGARLSAGDLIVRLDTRDRQARLKEAEALLYQREVEHTAARGLKPQGYITEGNLAETTARLEAARAELERARLDLGYTRIRAPFDGALLERLVEIGDYVAPGDPVARFVDERTLVVTASAAESDARHLAAGIAADAKLITGEQVSGTIRYVSPVADVSTRTFTVELELDNADGGLPVGVTAELRIPLETLRAQRISPALLTLNDAGELGVKTVDEHGRVVFHRAEIARADADTVWISGLPDNAQVITVGQGFVRPGDLVDARFELADGAHAVDGNTGSSL